MSFTLGSFGANLSALKFAIRIWVLAAIGLSCVFFFIGWNATGKPIDVETLLKHLFMGALLTCPLFPILLLLRRARERRDKRSKEITIDALSRAIKIIESNETVTFAYQPNTILFFSMAIFFFLCALLLFSDGMSNEKRIVIFRIIKLDVIETTFLKFILSAFTAFMGGMSLLVVVRSFRGKRSIVVTDNGLSTPEKIYSQGVRAVNLADAVDVKIKGAGKESAIHVLLDDGKIVIPMRALRSQLDFETLFVVLVSRVKMNRLTS